MDLYFQTNVFTSSVPRVYNPIYKLEKYNSHYPMYRNSYIDEINYIWSHILTGTQFGTGYL